MAKITLYGAEQYMRLGNDSLFANIVLPASCDKDTFIETLMLNAGEFPILFANCDFMKEGITKWSYKNQRAFERMFETWLEAYDPLHNYDMTEEFSDSETRNSGATSSDTQKTLNKTETSSGVISQSGTTNKVSAYDSNDFSNKDKAEGFVNETSGVNGSSDGTTQSDSVSSASDKRAADHKGRKYGNLGVTTSQQMAESEFTFRSKFNPYDAMIDSFVLEFLIPVY